MNQKQLEVLKKNNDETRDFIRSCFSFALIALLKKEKIENISITRLCSVAGVSRTAFYRNYNDIGDVLDDKIKELALKLSSNIGSDIYNNWLHVLKTIDGNRKDLETIIGGGYEHKILDIFISLLPENEDDRTIQTIWLSIIYSLSIKWLKEKKPKKVEDMARLAYKYTKNIPLVHIK